jgi:hypothetical protein
MDPTLGATLCDCESSGDHDCPILSSNIVSPLNIFNIRENTE